MSFVAFECLTSTAIHNPHYSELLWPSVRFVSTTLCSLPSEQTIFDLTSAMQARSHLCQTLHRSQQSSVPKPMVFLLLMLLGLQAYWPSCLLVLSLYRLLVHLQMTLFSHLPGMGIHQATTVATKIPLKSGANPMKSRGVILKGNATVMLQRTLMSKSSRVTSWFWDEKWTWKHPNTFRS